MRRIDYIVIHSSATKEGRDFRLKDVDAWHRLRGFSRIGYHFVVDLNGEVEKGRGLEEVGAHVRGKNANSIGICYIGGLSAIGKPKDTRTEAQKKALRELVEELKEKYPSAKVVGHRDLSKDLNGDGKITPNEFEKACPCFNVSTEL